MRKHNARFAARWPRLKGDRTNFPQKTAHEFANSKVSQFFNNTLLLAMFIRGGIIGAHA